MSFLAYFLRAYPESLSEYQNRIPDFVIRLLQDCPPEASATRKVFEYHVFYVFHVKFTCTLLKNFTLFLVE